MARKNQRLLGKWPSDPYSVPGYWQKINAERNKAIASEVDNLDVNWEEIREKYEAIEEEETEE